jgi:hypothetical protein
MARCGGARPGDGAVRPGRRASGAAPRALGRAVLAAVLLAVAAACTPAAAGPPSGLVVEAVFDTGADAPGLLRIGVAPPTGDVVVLVADRAGLPREVAAVEAVLTPPAGAPAPVWLHRVETGHHHGAADLAAPGRWLLAVTVRTGAGGTDTVAVPFTVPTPGG